MATMRELMERGDTMRELMEVGDPGRGFFKRAFRVPKRIRKLKVGRALMSAARAGVGFVPGPLGTIAQYAMGDPYEYGDAWEMGDPGRGGGKPKSKRKGASSGGKNKAAQRRKSKAPKDDPRKGHERRRGKSRVDKALELAGRAGAFAAEHAGQALELAQAFKSPATAIKQIDPEAILAGVGALPTGVPAIGGPMMARGLHLPGMRKKRTVIDVTALNRAARRIGRFENLVKRIHRSKPIRAITAHAPARGAARRHRAGCKCFACRGRA